MLMETTIANADRHDSIVVLVIVVVVVAAVAYVAA